MPSAGSSPCAGGRCDSVVRRRVVEFYGLGHTNPRTMAAPMKKKISKTKVPTPSKGRRHLILVEWGDAWSSSRWEEVGFEVGNVMIPEMVSTVGWLVQANDDGITVAGRIQESGACGVVSFIPNGMIKRVIHLTHDDIQSKPE